ncbi:Crp/Fnr family transcriptional regulator [Jhaorihella thermophila]|uniref:CRP/FNR family transcriptional regulator, anaerobic regulatory protein n=1 Tax=Jhaorihella thermophila TaxID=488547 RepID=A0A1H5WLN4_9RHOB|nr:Crp/Fnr family transcriptional regulator [Jhaorihella thermophila]SEG00243.1 CRP/FNR family transcriptional regulator, anaerobic regulatory protein [Jhaorihella thermophila]
MSRDALPLSCPAGTVIFRAGEDCPGFVRLTRGTIRVTLTAPNGREVVLYRVEPGDVCLQTFACLTDGRSYSAEGVAEADVEGEVIPHAVFRRRMAEDAAFREEVMAAVARRFADYEKLVEDVALTGFDARLARALLRLARGGEGIETTHEALAAETASGRAFVSRRLAEFARLGLIRPGRGRIRILDRAALERVADDDR